MAAIKVPQNDGKNAEKVYLVKEYIPGAPDNLSVYAAVGQPGKQRTSIRAILTKIHDDYAPDVLLTVFKQYWPNLKKITMKEAWLRIVYLEAIQGSPWATTFIANRTEGAVETGGLLEDKGTILSAIDRELQNPVPTDCEVIV
jgi:hypothetical protein